MKIVLPAQTKFGLCEKPELANTAKGDAGNGKSASFLQILRPKAGPKAKPEAASADNSNRAQAVSKPINSNGAVQHVAQSNPAAKSGQAITKTLAGKAMASNSEMSERKHSNDFSVLGVPIGQALQQVVSKAKAISLKKQPDNAIVNLPKPAQQNVAEGHVGRAKKQSKVALGNLNKATLLDAAGSQAGNGAKKINPTAQIGAVLKQKIETVAQQNLTPATKGSRPSLGHKEAQNKPNAALLPQNRNKPLIKSQIQTGADRKMMTQRAEQMPRGSQVKRPSVVAGGPQSVGIDTRVSRDSRITELSLLGKGDKDRKASARNGGEQMTSAGSEKQISKSTAKAVGSVTDSETAKRTIAAEEILQRGSVIRFNPVPNANTFSAKQSNPGAVALPKPTRLNQAPSKSQAAKISKASETIEGKTAKTTDLKDSQVSAIFKAKSVEKSVPLDQAKNQSSPHKPFSKPSASKETLESSAANRKPANKVEVQQTGNPQRPDKTVSVQLLEPRVTRMNHRVYSLGTSTREAAVYTDRKNRISPTPNVPDAIRDSIRQNSASQLQEPIVRNTGNTVEQLTGLQAVATSKSGLQLAPVTQKKVNPVLLKRSQRLRELARAATANKSGKPVISQTKSDSAGQKSPVGGMEDAFLKLDMNLAQKMKQFSNSGQEMPFGGRHAFREAGNHALIAAEMIEAGRSDLNHIKDVTARNDFANRLNQADVEVQSLQAKLTQPKGQSSVNTAMYRQIMSAAETFRGMNTSRWAITIEPASNLRVQLDLHMSDARLVVQAKLERGSQTIIGNGWSELQASLAEKDVDLKSLVTTSPNKEGHGNMFGGKNERQSGGANQDDESWFSEELSEMLAEFEKETQVPRKAKRSGRKARMPETTFESWA